MAEEKYIILLFYKYVHIEDPEALRISQRALCEKLSLTGRIIIAHEGINATVEGTKKNIELYVNEYLADPRFASTHIKKSEGTGAAFPKLSVKVRDEIVTLGLPQEENFNPAEVTGKRLSPEELKKWIAEGKEITIVDMRNEYEHLVGKFEGSVCMPLKNFRDVPKTMPLIEHLKEKTVVTVCTGDVRCEKGSGYLLKKGFTDVYHLDGGIVSYMEKYPGEDFKGSLYVFDQRMTMGFLPPEKKEIISKCFKCAIPTERIINADGKGQRLQITMCEKCDA